MDSEWICKDSEFAAHPSGQQDPLGVCGFFRRGPGLPLREEVGCKGYGWLR